MNQVGMVGRLTKDPSMREMSEGRTKTSFILAVSRNFKNVQGEIEADFVLCSVWGKQAQNVAKYCVKGSLIALSGRLQSRHYDREDGTRAYVTEVIGEHVRFLDNRKAKEEEGQGQSVPQSESDFNFQPPGTTGINVYT